MKKLKLTKQAFKNYFLGERLVWILCDENFLKLSKEYPEIQKIDKYRFKSLTDKEFDKKDITNIPESILDGYTVGDKYKEFYKTKYPNYKIFDFSSNFNILEVEKKTIEALENQDDLIMFEGGFKHRDFSLRADIIIKHGNNIKLIEAKAVTLPHKEHMYDVAYQKFIIDQYNSLQKFKWTYRILHLNSTFVYDSKLSYLDQIINLFKESSFYYNSTPQKDEYKIPKSNGLDLEENISNLMLEFDFDFIFNQIIDIQLKDELPYEQILDSYNLFGKNEYLDFFKMLEGMLFEDSIYYLKGDSGFSLKKKNQIWYEQGIKKIKDVDDYDLVSKAFINKNEKIPLLNDSSRNSFLRKNNLLRLIQKDSTIKNEPFLDVNLIKKHLSDYKLPIYMFDFEAVKFAVPIVDKTWPYEQIPYQYSVHIITDLENLDYENNKGFIHLEYLAQNKNSFYLELFENLVKDLTSQGLGTYVAYNKAFEQMVIKNALNDFKGLPIELRNQLEEINSRMIDLMIPFQKMYYYHPEFKGSYSIKYVTKAFTNLDYQNLDELVRKGDQSAVQCKKWLLGNEEEAQISWINIRDIMLKYCMYDTLSMVGIFEKLIKLTKA